MNKDQWQEQAPQRCETTKESINTISHPSQAPDIQYGPHAFDNEPISEPLKENEKCINGERFRRIQNGWASAKPKNC